ncbi:MAG: PEP-CTERM sorting domain-containing protein [Planctomycetota bacterium]
MKKQILAAAIAAAFVSTSAFAAPSLVPVVTNDQAAGGTLPSGFAVGGFGAVGGTLYAFLSSNNSGTGYVTAGTPGGDLTPVIGSIALSGLGAGYDDGLSPNGEVLTVGSTLIVPDSLTGGFVAIDTSNGNALTLLLDNTQIAAATAPTDTSVRRPLGSAVTPNGGLLFFDGDSASDVLLASNLTPGNVSVVATDAELTALLGSDDIDGGTVAGGSYFATGSGFDAIARADFDTNGDLDASTFTTVIDTTTYESIIDPDDTSPSLTPREMITGGDGLVYFYDGDVDGVVSFDPADPIGTLQIAVSEDVLLAGAGNDSVVDLLWFDDKLHVQVAGANAGTLFAVVPEPASLGLLALGGLALRRRR